MGVFTVVGDDGTPASLVTQAPVAITIDGALTGAKGDTGPVGTAATVSVGTVTTGAAGSSATVTNVGTPTIATLNFGIPKGDKGDKGDTGDTGVPGADGAGVPVGGTKGQLQYKKSSTNYDTGWFDAPVINVKVYGAIGNGTADDTAAIQAAIDAAATAGGGIVWIPDGTYMISATLNLKTGVSLEGAHGVSWPFRFPTAVCRLKGTAGFTSSGTSRGLIALRGQEVTGSAGNEGNMRIRNIELDGEAITDTAVNGIHAYGQVMDVIIDNVTVKLFPHNGVMCEKNGTTGNPHDWFMDKVVCYGNGAFGFSLVLTDGFVRGCIASSSGNSGWFFNLVGNITFDHCEALWNTGHGFEFPSAGYVGAGTVFANIQTDRNGKDGINWSSTTGNGYILFNGLALNRDGRNGGTGGGSYACFHAAGSTRPIIINGITTQTGKDDDATGTESPQYGVSVGTSTYVSIHGGIIKGVTEAIHDAGGNAHFRIGPNILTAIVSGGTTVYSYANNWGTDSGSTATLAASAADQTVLELTSTSTNVAGALLHFTTGSAISDLIIKSQITGDVNNRYAVGVDGKYSWGPGSSGADTNLYRNGVGVLKTDGSLTVANRIGIGAASPGTQRIYATDAANEAVATLITTASGVSGNAIPVIDVQTVDTTNRSFGTILSSGDTNRRMVIYGDGKLEWGSGAATRDTVLYRNAAAVLKTDGGLLVGTPGTTAGSVATIDGTQTLTNKTLTSPAITTPTGIVKGDVGLGNVDNTSDATKNSAVAALTNKDLTSGTNTFPTLNQNTSGTAAGLSAVLAPASGGTGVANSKNLTVSNALTLAGTDSTVMTFPSTSATIARTDAANTFTGHQTIEGVTSTGATGTGNLVFATSPVLTTPTRVATPAVNDNSLALATTAYADRNVFLPAVVSFKEDFMQASSTSVTTATTLGYDINWSAAQIVGGTQTVAAATGSFANPGNILLTTSATSGQGVSIYRSGNAKAPLGALGSNAGWEAHFIFKLGATTTNCFRVGFVTEGSQVTDAPNGIYLEYDTANTGNTDTKFTWVTKSGGTPTYGTTNAINADTAFHHLRIRSTIAGTIAFQIDGGTEYTTSSNVSTSNLQMIHHLITRTAGTATATLDFTSYIANTGRS